MQMGISCTTLSTASTQRKVLVPDSPKLIVRVWYHRDNSLHCWLQSWSFVTTEVLIVHGKQNSEHRWSPPSLIFLVDALYFCATGPLQTEAEDLHCSWCHLCYFLLSCQQFLSHLFLCPALVLSLETFFTGIPLMCNYSCLCPLLTCFWKIVPTDGITVLQNTCMQLVIALFWHPDWRQVITDVILTSACLFYRCQASVLATLYWYEATQPILPLQGHALL